MAKTIFCCILVALACGCVQAADSSITDLKSANFQQLKLEASSFELNERQCNKDYLWEFRNRLTELQFQKVIDFKTKYSVDRLVEKHLKKCVDAKLYK